MESNYTTFFGGRALTWVSEKKEAKHRSPSEKKTAIITPLKDDISKLAELKQQLPQKVILTFRRCGLSL